jgi:hypothetical protein
MEADIKKGEYKIYGNRKEGSRVMNTRSRNTVVTEGLHLTNVTRGGCNDNKPKIHFFAEWTSRMGFTPYALTQAPPVQ